MKKLKPRYIILLIILFVYLLVMYLVVGRDNLRKEKLTTKLIVGNSSVWELSNKQWTNIVTSMELKEFSWSFYNIYEDNKDIGKYYLWYDDEEWFVFDKKKEPINLEGKLLAYQANYKIPLKEFTSEQINDFSKIEKNLSNKNIDIDSELTVSSFVEIDIDNDGNDEVIYLISNAFPEESDPDEIFTYVFMKKDNSTYVMYDEREENTGYVGCKPYINYVLDIDEDKKYEIILSCGKYSDQRQLDRLLKFEKEGFKLLIDNNP